MSNLYCLELVYFKNYFNPTKISFLRLFKIKQSAPGLNRGLVTNFWWLKNANHAKLTVGICDVYGEAGFIFKKCLQIG